MKDLVTRKYSVFLTWMITVVSAITLGILRAFIADDSAPELVNKGYTFFLLLILPLVFILSMIFMHILNARFSLGVFLSSTICCFIGIFVALLAYSLPRLLQDFSLLLLAIDIILVTILAGTGALALKLYFLMQVPDSFAEADLHDD